LRRVEAISPDSSESGIEIKDDTSDGATKGSGLMHHKFIIVDGKATVITSGNLTRSDL